MKVKFEEFEKERTTFEKINEGECFMSVAKGSVIYGVPCMKMSYHSSKNTVQLGNGKAWFFSTDSIVEQLEAFVVVNKKLS